jgi:hypothetical protein
VRTVAVHKAAQGLAVPDGEGDEPAVGQNKRSLCSSNEVLRICGSDHVIRDLEKLMSAGAYVTLRQCCDTRAAACP